MKTIHNKIETELEKRNITSAFVVLTKIKTTNQDIDPYFITDSKLGENLDILDITSSFDDGCNYTLSFHKPSNNIKDINKFTDNIVTSFDIKSNMKINHTYCHMFKTKDEYIMSQVVESKARFSKVKNVTEPFIYGSLMVE